MLIQSLIQRNKRRSKNEQLKENFQFNSNKRREEIRILVLLLPGFFLEQQQCSGGKCC
jgi:hypothetical protein